MSVRGSLPWAAAPPPGTACADCTPPCPTPHSALTFAVPGASERLWRAFLRTARAFPDAVAVGLSQGFHPAVRKALNAAYVEAEKSYNAFAASVK